MQQFTAVPCTTDRYYLGECARFDDVRNELLWVNVDRTEGTFFRATVDGPSVTIVARYTMPGALTAVAPFEDRDQGWIVACDDALVHLSGTGATTVLARPEAHQGGAVRTNDGAADPWGTFWIGSMARTAEPGRGSLYRYHEGAPLETVLTNLTIANGIGWSPDRRTMYYVDSGPGTLRAFDLDDSGAILTERLLVAFDVPREGTPDGLCVDVEGALWVAVWGGSEVRRYDPSGALLARVAVGTSQPSCCTIGGANGTTLYITTAQEDMSDEQLAAEPDAGRLFTCEVGVRGLPLNPYRPARHDRLF
jgi:sugar lactone lactonase YvrE